jgi:outer membrane protein assembly factor BamB
VDGVVYTGGFDGTASAVDASTGDILWTFDTEEPIVADIEVGDGLVHVPSTSGIHWALDPATGDKDWAAFVGGAETTSPLVVDGAAILGSRAAVLQAYDAESGDSLWTVPYEGSWVESGAVVIGPDAFVIGSSDIRVVQAFRISDGSLIWSTPVSGAPWAVPVVADGVVYATQISWGPWEPWDASVYALNSHTGEILWSAKTGDALDWTPMDNGGFGIAASPAIAGDYVVVAGLDGVVYAFKR